MDFSKLGENEKLAVYGAIASIVGPALAAAGFGVGVGWLTLLLALAILAVVFLPQLSPQTTLPGSKGSLMLIVGGIAAVSAALALIASFRLLGAFGSDPLFVLGWLIGIAGGLLMGWAGWKEFQAEGGTLQLGTPTGGAATRDTPQEPAPEAPREATGETPTPEATGETYGPASTGAAPPAAPEHDPAAPDQPAHEDDRPPA